MNKQQIIKEFAGGFTVGDSKFPDNFLLDKANTKDNQLWLLAYDANLMPATPFATWNTKYRKQIIQELKQYHKLKGSGLAVYIDGEKVISHA